MEKLAYTLGVRRALKLLGIKAKDKVQSWLSKRMEQELSQLDREAVKMKQRVQRVQRRKRR